MNAAVNKKQSGFTIIEVVLVLAIAGLIFLMVFIALPTLQRNTRDTQRKTDLSRVKTALQNYSSSNKGSIPLNASKMNEFKANFMTPAIEYQDPQTGEYILSYAGNTSHANTFDQGVIVYQNGSVCGDNGTFIPGGARDYAIKIKLEGQAVPHCIDSK